MPFRLVDDDKQFKKWQWITARIEKAPGDHRPESHRVFVDTIQCEGDPLPTKNEWQARRSQLEKIPVFSDFAALEEARVSAGATLGLLRPSRIIGLDIAPSDKPEWTEEERQKLIQDELLVFLTKLTPSASLSGLAVTRAAR